MSLFLLLLVSLAMASSSSAAASPEVTVEQVQARMRAHLAHVDDQIRALDYLLNKYYADWNYTEEDAHDYVSNPINTYMLIKRTGLEWPNVKKVLFNETAEAEARELEDMVKKLQEQQGRKETSVGTDKDEL